MRTLLVVILSAGFDLWSCLTQTGKPIRVQTFIAQSPIEALYIDILHRLARMDELQPHVAFFGPPTPGRETPGRCPERWLPAILSRWRSDATPGALATRPADRSTSIAGHSRVQSATMVNMRITFRRRIRWSGAVAKPVASQPNQRWSMDFVSDCVSTGKLSNPHRQSFLAIQPVHTVRVRRRG